MLNVAPSKHSKPPKIIHKAEPTEDARKHNRKNIRVELSA